MGYLWPWLRLWAWLWLWLWAWGIASALGAVEAMSIRGVLDKLKWQRVPVSALKITEPRAEEVTSTLHAVLFVLLSVATGFTLRSFPAPVLGAASLTDDFWYIFVFKFLFLLSIPLFWYYGRWLTSHAGVGESRLRLTWLSARSDQPREFFGNAGAGQHDDWG